MKHLLIALALAAFSIGCDQPAETATNTSTETKTPPVEQP
jgi:hypothetical protein